MVFHFLYWLLIGAGSRKAKTSPLAEFVNYVLLLALLGALGRCRG